MSSLAVYHIPCNHTSEQLPTGFCTCPKYLTISLPLFRRKTIKYVPWIPSHASNSTIQLHYKSLSIPPPLKFNKSVINALDKTFHRIDGDLAEKIKTIRKDITDLHEVAAFPVTLVIASIALGFSLLNTLIFIILCCYHRRRRHNQPDLNLVHYVQVQKNNRRQAPVHRPLPAIPEEEIPMQDICPDCGEPETTNVNTLNTVFSNTNALNSTIHEDCFILAPLRFTKIHERISKIHEDPRHGTVKENKRTLTVFCQHIYPIYNQIFTHILCTSRTALTSLIFQELLILMLRTSRGFPYILYYSSI